MQFPPAHIYTKLGVRGIDHGTWSILVHAFPDASIPVVQLPSTPTSPWTSTSNWAPSCTRVLIDGYAYGSLTMTAYTLGMEGPTPTHDGGSPQVTGDPPPDGANI